jgi:hypothetical protein
VDFVGGLHYGIAGFINALPMPSTGSGEDRSSARCTLLGLHDFDRMSVYVGLNLAPKDGSGAAASQANKINWNFHLAEDSEAVSQTERNPFQNGADHVGASV